MKSLILGGSSTHGSETVSPVYNIENTKHSWANLLSEKLGYVPDNQAIPGNSNEAIFHAAIEKLQHYDQRRGKNFAQTFPELKNGMNHYEQYDL